MEMVHFGKGRVSSKRHYTCSKRLADDVQEIALKCGYSATITCVKRSIPNHWSKEPEYRVNLCETQTAQINLVEARDSWVPYKGYVYCATVPNETLLVRRNGKVVYSGNSKVHDTHNIMLACRAWGLRSTDIMQGVLYGTRTQEIDPSAQPDSSTRFDFDECFVEDTDIIANPEVRKISDVEVGEPVLTHSGSFQPVLQKMVRDYSGEIYRLSFVGGSVCVTPNHPFLVILKEGSHAVILRTTVDECQGNFGLVREKD